MNWVFWFLIILVLFLIWVGLGILFKPIGKFFDSILRDLLDIFNDK